MRTTVNYTFYCRKSKANKFNLAPVEICINICGKRVFIQLPRKEHPEDFAKAVAAKRNNPIKEYIEQVRLQLGEVQVQMMREGIPFTSETLKKYFQNGGVKPYTVKDMFEDFLRINKPRIGKSITTGAYKKYEYLRDLFLSLYSPDMEARTLTPSVAEAFYIHLQTNYKAATAASKMARFKTVVMFAVNDGKLTNPFGNLRIRRPKEEIIYLTDEEIDKLLNLKLDNESLIRVRDNFIVQMSTGLSYIDLADLKKEDIKTDADGTPYIIKKRHKTGVEYTTVVLPMGMEVLRKYDYNLHVISNQKYNVYLKQLQAMAGITTTLTTHVARRTFATRSLKKVRMEVVSKMLGHASVRQTETAYAAVNKTLILQEAKKLVD